MCDDLPMGERAMNDRLISVLHDIDGISFSKKQHRKRLQRIYEQSDSLIAKQAEKKPTLYNEVKTLDYITTRVGPVYSRIVKQKRRAELELAQQTK